MDETPNPTTRMGSPEPVGAGLGAPPPPAAVPPPPGAVPPLPPPPPPPAAPAPPTGWDQPYREHRTNDGSRFLSLLIGIFLIAIGLWFFFERTLGFDMPDIRWSQLWPVILIVIGVVVLFGATRRDRR